MKFWFVRHGKSCHNAAGLFCGSIDSPLTEEGYRQARRLAHFFTGKPCDWIATSPLMRAHDTATVVAATQGLRVHVDDRLTEHAKGELENTPYTKMRSAAWRDVPGAETMEALYGRTLDALRSLAHLQGVGVVVAHAGVARAVEAIRIGAEPADLYDLPKVGNAEPYLVDVDV